MTPNSKFVLLFINAFQLNNSTLLKFELFIFSQPRIFYMKTSKPRVVGNYILKKRIGKGSFATVWCAEHKIAGENVAIKVIHNKSIDSEEARTRFVREINIIKQTDHPFISKLFEIIETKDDT